MFEVCDQPPQAMAALRTVLAYPLRHFTLSIYEYESGLRPTLSSPMISTFNRRSATGRMHNRFRALKRPATLGSSAAANLSQ